MSLHVSAQRWFFPASLTLWFFWPSKLMVWMWIHCKVKFQALQSDRISCHPWKWFWRFAKDTFKPLIKGVDVDVLCVCNPYQVLAVFQTLFWALDMGSFPPPCNLTLYALSEFPWQAKRLSTECKSSSLALEHLLSSLAVVPLLRSAGSEPLGNQKGGDWAPESRQISRG